VSVCVFFSCRHELNQLAQPRSELAAADGQALIQQAINALNESSRAAAGGTAVVENPSQLAANDQRVFKLLGGAMKEIADWDRTAEFTLEAAMTRVDASDAAALGTEAGDSRPRRRSFRFVVRRPSDTSLSVSVAPRSSATFPAVPTLCAVSLSTTTRPTRSTSTLHITTRPRRMVPSSRPSETSVRRH
jgi:hypothetical protein